MIDGLRITAPLKSLGLAEHNLLILLMGGHRESGLKDFLESFVQKTVRDSGETYGVDLYGRYLEPCGARGGHLGNFLQVAIGREGRPEPDVDHGLVANVRNLRPESLLRIDRARGFIERHVDDSRRPSRRCRPGGRRDPFALIRSSMHVSIDKSGQN